MITILVFPRYLAIFYRKFIEIICNASRLRFIKLNGKADEQLQERHELISILISLYPSHTHNNCFHGQLIIGGKQKPSPVSAVHIIFARPPRDCSIETCLIRMNIIFVAIHRNSLRPYILWPHYRALSFCFICYSTLLLPGIVSKIPDHRLPMEQRNKNKRIKSTHVFQFSTPTYGRLSLLA